MGQWDILNLLKENKGKWFTTRELSDQLDASFSSVGSSVKKLRKAALIESKRMEWSTKMIFKYRYKKV